MILVGLVVFAVLGYIMFTGIQFTIFKSKLMNEFGKRGVSFEKADDFFTENSKGINDLHHSGMPVDQIVARCLDDVNEIQAVSGTKSSGIGKNAGSKGGLKQVQKVTPSNHALVEFIAGMLGLQAMLFANEDGTYPEGALDDWSIGYVAGASDAVLQKNGIGQDVNGFAVMTLIFVEVFGLERGPDFFGKFMRLQQQRNQAVHDGMETGGRDVFGWMDNSIQVPTGWTAHVHGLDKA